MKKRLLSALLALALVFVLLPTTALAKVVKSDEDISIAGIDWKFESDSEVGYFYNGNFTTTEPSDSYLKLTKNSNTITVTVYGNVTVSDIKVHKNIDIGEKINLIITGGNKRSTLTLDCTGISGAALETFQSGDITIKGGVTVNANFSANNTKNFTDCYGISASKNLIITDSGTIVNAVNADHDAAAVKVGGNITVSDGAQLKATNKYYGSNNTDKAYAIKCGQLSISGNNTKVTAKTSNGKQAISGTVSNGDKLTFKVPLAGSTLHQKPMDEALKYTHVVITQAPTDPYVFIAGTTLLNDTYYTITNDSTVVANGSESNYNAFYDSETKTLKLNNAKISTTTGTAIKIEEDLTITITGTNELNGNYNHCIESDNNFKINGTGRLVMTNGSNTDASVIYCGPGKSLTIAAEVIIKNAAQPGKLIHTVKDDAYSFAEGYNVYASTDVSGSPLEVYNPENYGNYKYLRVTKENLAPTTPTTYTVTITAGDNMKRESGALTQEVTKGAAITEVKFMAASGHYFPADYVSKMNLPAGLTAEIRENSWYLIISGTPTSDVTINLPAASVRPTITVSMPTPVAGNTPATASDITLTYSDINKSISKNLTISNVVWQSYVPNGDGSITPGEALSSGDKFEAGKTYFVRITHEYVAGDYDIVPAAGITLDYTESDSTYMMLLFYTTGAPCNHEYTNDWLANGNTHWHECKLCRAHAGEVAHTFGDWITDTPATDTTDGSKHRTCSVCQYQENATIPKTGTGEIVPPTPDNPGTIVIIRPAEEEKPAQQPNPSTGANDLVGMAVAAAVVAVLGSVALLRKHD